ncbi:MAG TPA: hypothetical protein VM901_07645 [Bdellovibrionota bacterium]|jgi:hypothetical protein|nr:hypothetical protein [Bdellovibrionota bacterium]
MQRFGALLISAVLVTTPSESQAAMSPRCRAILGTVGSVVGTIVTAAAYYHFQIRPEVLDTQKPAAPIPVEKGTPYLPKTFRVGHNKLEPFVDSFRVVDDQYHYGNMREQYFAWGQTFDFVTKDGAKLATAKQKAFSWGTEIEYFHGDQKIGSIREDLIRSAFTPTFNKYEIFDAQGNRVGYSEKLELFGSNNIMFYNPQGVHVASVHGGKYSIPEHSWSVEVKQPSEIPNEILGFVAAYKSKADLERQRAEEAEAAEREKEEREKAERESSSSSSRK